MSVVERLKRRRREEQEIRGYASSSRWYTGLSNTINFLDRAETGEDPLGRFGDAWGAVYNLFMMYGEPGDEEFKRFNSWVTDIKDQPAIRNFFQRGDSNQELASFRSSIERVKGKLLKAQGQQELHAWGTQRSPEKVCRYFFGIIRDMRNTVYHPAFNPNTGPVMNALASAADCLIPVAAAAAEAIIEKPVEGTTGRTTAYRFFLYPFLKNSDGFFSDYYLERLFPDDELGGFSEDQARETLKSTAKESEAREGRLKQADSEETLRDWCNPALFKILEMKPDPGVRIISEDAVFEPTLVLRCRGSSALRSEYRGKEAAKNIAALLWILPWRSTLDAVSTHPAFESVPVTEVVHGALARSDVPWAIVTNGHQMRLFSKASAHRPRCFLEADLSAIIDRRGDPQAIRAFRFLLGLFSGPSLIELDDSGKTRLERVAIGSERHGKEIGDELKQNVYTALEELGEGFLDYLRSRPTDLDHWRERKARNLSRERFLASDELLEDIYHESLSLMYRLLFLFYAESRELLPVDNEVYQTYSLEALRDDVHSVLDDPDPKAFFAKGNTDLWQRLKELFKFLDRGWSNIIPPYNGGLFDPEKHEFLERFAVGDHYLARAIDLLSRTRPRAGQSRGEGRKKVTYRDLDVRHLGSIYEGILEYSAHIADEDLVVMRTGSGGSAEEDYVAVAELTREQKQQLAAWREAVEENPGNPKLPRGCKVAGRKEKGQYYLVYGGKESKRKSSGSYYTPDYIVQYIVENTLGPLVGGECRPQAEPLSEEVERQLKKIGATEERRRTGPLTSDEILELKVLDPAMGSGHFLVAATEYLARAYQQACRREGKTLSETGAEQEFIRAKRMITERCIYGVDLNPMAVELSKLSMWLFTMDPGRPLSFLDHHLKCGNALIGAWIKDLGRLPRFDRNDRPVLAQDDGQGNLFEQQFRIKLPLMLKDIFGIMSKDTQTTADIDLKKALDEAVQELREPFRNVANVWVGSLFGEDAKGYITVLSNLAEAQQLFSPKAHEKRFFHWELDFPEVYFSESGDPAITPGFHAVIGNPPYVSFGLGGVGVLDEREKAVYFALLPDGAEYKISYYALFIAIGLRLCRDRGVLSYIVPDSFLVGSYFSKIRQAIMKRTCPRKFVVFRKDFWEAGEVGLPTILVLSSGRRASLPCPNVSVASVATPEELKDLQNYCSYSPDIYDQFPRNRFHLFFDPRHKLLAENLLKCPATLGDYVTLHHGIRSKTGRDKIVARIAAGQSWHRALVGSDQVTPFRIEYRGDFINTNPKNLFSGGYDSALVAKPKLLIRRTGDTVICAVDLSGYYHTNALIYSETAQPLSVDDLDLLCGLLNSDVVNCFYQIMSMKKGRVLPQIEIDFVHSLPIPALEGGLRARLVALSKRLRLNRMSRQEFADTRNQLNRLVVEAYGLTRDEEESVLDYLTKEAEQTDAPGVMH